MKIKLNSPGESLMTVIETGHYVTITDPHIGFIIEHDGVCLTVAARNDGFELLCWKGTAEHEAALPSGALMFEVHPDRGVTDLTEGGC